MQITQAVEMRRDSARELHLLAGLAGESIISNEMTKKIAEMLKIFVRRAQEKLENNKVCGFFNCLLNYL